MEAGAGLRVISSGVGSEAAAISRPELNRLAAAKAESERARKHDNDSDGRGGGGYAAELSRAEDSGGGWRHPGPTALAMRLVTNESSLAEMSRERYGIPLTHGTRPTVLLIQRLVSAVAVCVFLRVSRPRHSGVEAIPRFVPAGDILEKPLVTCVISAVMVIATFIRCALLLL